MKLQKSLNNNVAMLLDDQGVECIAIGRGISFNKKEGDQIDSQKIDKLFVIKDKECQSRLVNIISDISPEYLIVTEEIVEMIRKKGFSISDMLYITLVDHISVSIERERRHDIFENPLLIDIKKFYKDEYQLAKQSNHIIFQHFGLYVSDSELGFITLHIVNALNKQSVPNTIQITRSTSDIVNLVEGIYHIRFDENSIRYERFVRHIMFLVQRVLMNNQETEIELPLQYQDDEKLKETVERIRAYFYGKYGICLNQNEVDFLKYHILIITQK